MTTSALNTPKDYALFYRKELGFSVFILKNPETGTTTTELQLRDRKRPALSWEPFKKRHATEEEIEQWFKFNPNYNTAIVTGSISKIIAFDVDGLTTAGRRVEEQRMKMSTNLRVALDNTMMNKTGSGGTHIIFRIEEDISDISNKILWSDGQPHSQILMQGNDHYIIGAPSVHPNDNKYEWNGKEPQLITRQELDEFIRLMSPTEQKSVTGNFPVSVRETQQPQTTTRTLSPEQMQELISWIKPYYTPGTRDHIIFFISGMFRKDGGFSLNDARAFIELLCNESGYPDEDLDKSLQVVDNTYKKESLDSLNGKSGLHELLITSHETAKRDEYLARAEAFSQICQIVNSEPESPPNNDDDPADDDDTPGGGGGGGGDDKNKTNNKKLVSSGEELLRDKTVEDENTMIISFLAKEVMSRVALKSFFDTHEIIYYDARRKHYRHGGGHDGGSIIDAEIEKIVEEIKAPYTVRSYIKTEVQKCIADKNIVNREDFDADPYTINLENCLLDIIELKQMEQTPEHLTMSKFPVVYDPSAECPRIERFLGEVIQDLHKLREILKFIAYLLLKDCRYEKALMLLGAGANGKSKLIALLEAFVGKDNCSNLSLHELEEDRFGRARLFGKALNTYADNKSQRLKETGNLKTVISGDTIEGQNKFKPRFSFRPRAKLAVSTNNPPETEDKTHAFYRRWLMAQCERTFIVTDDINDPNRRDPDLEAKITRPDELSGLLNLALRYVPILIKEGGFAEEPIDKVKNEYESKADHISRYLQKYWVVDSSKKDYFTKTGELYDHYVKICNKDQIRALDENVFGSRLVEHGILKKRRRLRGSNTIREYVYEPVAFRDVVHSQQDSILQGNVDSGEEEKKEALPSWMHTASTTEEHAAITSLECPRCALENSAGNSLLFEAKSTRELQLHMIFKHPELDFEEIGEDDY